MKNYYLWKLFKRMCLYKLEENSVNIMEIWEKVECKASFTTFLCPCDKITEKHKIAFLEDTFNTDQYY